MTTEYMQQRIDAGNALRAQAEGIIDALGPCWTPEVSTDSDTPALVVGVRAVHADGMRLNFFKAWNKARFDISPIVPPRHDAFSGALRDWGVAPYNMPEPRCTVAMDRDPAQAAKQITRTVIEPYAPMYAAIITQRDADTARAGELANGLKTLSEGLAPYGEVRTTDNSAKGTRSDFQVIRRPSYHTVIKGTVRDGTADIQIDGVPLDVVLKLVAMVEAARPKAEG